MSDDKQALIDDFVAVLPRVFQRDFTVFGTEADEVRNRLNWLVAPDVTDVSALDSFAAQLDAIGVDHVVLCGMGGSSLYPRTLLPYHSATRKVTVVDTTHPDALRQIDETLHYPSSLFVFASKSGSTAETTAMRTFFTSRLHATTPDAKHRLAVITDPGSSLAKEATEQHFGQILLADPDVGGRFSAHTLFGVTVSALAGLDVTAHLEAAKRAFLALRAADKQNVAIRLAAQLATAVNRRGSVAQVEVELHGIDDTFGLWIEQLLVESLGKDGVGVHVVSAPATAPCDVILTVKQNAALALPSLEENGTHTTLSVPAGHHGIAMAAAVMMLATALAGRGIQVNPFDQPDVAAAKQATDEALAARRALPPPRDVSDVLAEVPSGTPLIILAYVAPDSPDEQHMRRAAIALGQQRHTTVTVGVGPRYLHSTGQLHKGAFANACYLVIGPSFTTDLAIADDTFTFGELILAQAAGDVAALTARGRQVHVITAEGLHAHVS